jgi:hypothetical protein
MRLYLKKIPNTKRAGGVAQCVGPEFKTRYCKKIIIILDFGVEG